MPHINAEAKTITITGLSGYILLCSSTVGLYIGQDGRIVKSDGSGSLKVQILDVPSSVGFVCKFMDSPGSATFADYNGGKVYFDNQVVLEPENRIIPGNTLELASAAGPGAESSIHFAAVQSLLTAATREGNRLSGTFGTNCTSFDTPNLDLDSNGGNLIVTMSGQSVGNTASLLNLRVNGSSSNISRSGWYATIGGNFAVSSGANSLLGNVNAANGAAGAKWSLSMLILGGRSGKIRSLALLFVNDYDPTTPVRYTNFFFFTPNFTTNITSIGIETNVANDMASASTYQVIRL